MVKCAANRVGNTLAVADGSTHGIGSLNGTVTTASMLNATLTFTTDGSTAITEHGIVLTLSGS